jgi:hypothetical protein
MGGVPEYDFWGREKFPSSARNRTIEGPDNILVITVIMMTWQTPVARYVTKI